MRLHAMSSDMCSSCTQYECMDDHPSGLKSLRARISPMWASSADVLRRSSTTRARNP